MAKGLCCAAQAAGDLGKPLVITVTHKDGTTSERCGVCEVVPSCKHPQKAVFAFRFLAKNICGLLGGKACTPTAAGIAQYTRDRTVAAAGREVTEYAVANGNVFRPRPIPGGATPYALPAP